MPRYFSAFLSTLSATGFFLLLLMPVLLVAQTPNNASVESEKQTKKSIDSLLVLAWSTGRSYPNTSIQKLQLVELLHQQQNSQHKKDVVLYYYGVFYKNLNRFEESEKAFDAYEVLQASKGNKRQVASVNMAKANLYSDWGNYPKSMAAVTKSLSMYDELKDTAGVVLAGSKMGYLLSETGRLQDALQYHQKSIRLSALIHNAKEEMIGYTNCGVVYEKMRRFDSAAYYYEKAYRMGEVQKDDYSKVINRFNMANVYNKLHQPKLAMPYLQSCISLADSIKIPSLSAASRALLGEVNINNGQPAEGIALLEPLVAKNAYPLGLKDRYEVHEQLVKGYKLTGRFKEAFEELEILKVLNDSLVGLEARTQMNEIETRYETEKRKQQIALLIAENSLAQLELQRKEDISEALRVENALRGEKLQQQQQLNNALLIAKNLSDSNLYQQSLLTEAVSREKLLQEKKLQQEERINALLTIENDLKQASLTASKKSMQQLGVGLLAVALLGAIIFYQYRRQVKQNLVIARQSEDLQILNREIHHRVKNNLQVVSSMLSLQAETIPDAITAAKFDEGSKRVQSMAFIHQNLYQGESVNSVNMTEYIKMLVEHLFEAYNISPERIKLRTDIENLKLHTDTVIPIGMILNELISNALKYAFKGLEDGEIKVSLRQQENLLALRVKDNGVGMAKPFDEASLSSFGYKIISAFSRKLKARLNVYHTNGTEVELLISKFKIV